jgi:hypothetical protein
MNGTIDSFGRKSVELAASRLSRARLLSEAIESPEACMTVIHIATHFNHDGQFGELMNTVLPT